MKSYVLVDLNFQDPELFKQYAQEMNALIIKYNAKYLVQGATPEILLSSSESPEKIVVLEFPSRKEANGFFDERNKLGLSDLFSKATQNSRIILVDGVE